MRFADEEGIEDVALTLVVLKNIVVLNSWVVLKNDVVLTNCVELKDNVESVVKEEMVELIVRIVDDSDTVVDSGLVESDVELSRVLV